ncbi:MAG: BlaI/MecI/CopY family transcriptional regulator [Saccharofermentans sp.]|nr:BlaI/MecI/CopY family transcriptional regulator [Saccharofermentans sp.]
MDIQLGPVESKFADMIWEHEPVSSTSLVKMTSEEFGWARTTTHNVIRRLCDKGIFANNKGTVTSLISRDEFYSKQSKQYVDDSFSGSLPAFIAAFTKNTQLSRSEIQEIKDLIDSMGE